MSYREKRAERGRKIWAHVELLMEAKAREDAVAQRRAQIRVVRGTDKAAGWCGVKLFDNPDALLAAGTLTDIRAATPARQRRKELLEAQEQRLRLLQRDGYVAVVGANGMTVFRGQGQY